MVKREKRSFRNGRLIKFINYNPMTLLLLFFLFTYIFTISTAFLFPKVNVDIKKAFIPFIGTHEVMKMLGKPMYWLSLIHI